MGAILATLGLVVSSYAALAWSRGGRRREAGLHAPPGPPGFPLIGNLFDVSLKEGHVRYAEWAKVYGPLIQLKVLNQKIVIVNSQDVATDLFENRGSIYSHRPPMHMLNLCGWECLGAHMSERDMWRVRRRLLHQAWQPAKISQYHGIMKKTALELAKNLLERPEGFDAHVRRTAAANVLEAVYGINVALENDPYVEIARKAGHSFDNIVLPGTNILDWLPFLRHLPEWTPGLTFYRTARELRKYPEALLGVPYARFKEDMKKGVAPSCMMSQCLELLDPESGVDELAVKEVGGVSYMGGSDTSAASVMNFLRAMILYPECQKKAQDELDRVVGRGRLPDFADRSALPYIEAVIRETFRKYPAAPLGVPHALEDDDVYQGMVLEKGTTVFANQWAILQDPVSHPDPDAFNAERFLKDGQISSEVPDPRNASFGYGRRICPGRHFADAAVFLIVATMLHCFSVSVYTEDGVEDPPSEEMTMGVISHPVPFRCRIEPRFPELAALVNQAYEFRPE